MVEGWVHAEFVVRAAISEVQAGGYREVGFECDRELVEKAFACRRGMRDEDTGFCRVINPISGVYKLSHL